MKENDRTLIETSDMSGSDDEVKKGNMMTKKNEMGHSMIFKSKAHEISNQSMHTSWSPNPM